MPVNACCCACPCVEGNWTVSNVKLNGNGTAALPAMPCGDDWTAPISGLSAYLVIDSDVNTGYADISFLQGYWAGSASDGCNHYVNDWLQSLSPYDPGFANYYDELFNTGNTVERFIAWLYACSPAYMDTYGNATNCDYRGPVFGCAWQLCIRKPDDTFLGVGSFIGCADMLTRMHAPIKQANGTCKWTIDSVCNIAAGAGGWWFLGGNATTISCCPTDGANGTLSMPLDFGTVTGNLTFAEAGI